MKGKPRQVWLKQITGLLAVIAAILFFLAFESGYEKEERLPFKTITPKLDTLVRTLTVLGKVVPKAKENVVIEVPGILQDLLVTEGEIVEKGQRLLTIQSSPQEEKLLFAKQQVLATRSEVERAQKELERLRHLYQLNETSEKQLDEQMRKLSGLQEALLLDQEILVLQKRRLEQTIVRAPSKGMVLYASPLERGSQVNAGQLLLSIVSGEGFNIEVPFNQDDAAKIRIGQEVSFQSLNTSLGKTSQTGRIGFVAPEIKAGLVKAIVIPDERLTTRLGSSVEVSMQLHSKTLALIVPIEIVRMNEGKAYVFMFEKGMIKMHNVTTGQHNHQSIEIFTSNEVSEKSLIIASHFEELFGKFKN